MVFKAVDLFVGLAYPDGSPQKVRSILHTLQSAGVDFYTSAAFERGSDPNRPAFSLRLGNAHYPHAKLAIESIPETLGFFFRVDSHDKAMLVARQT